MKTLFIVFCCFVLLDFQEMRSQDSLFKPSAKYDKSTGNYIITYWKDSTGREYQTLFVPCTKIKPSILATIRNENTKYIYSYTITNKKDGKQAIVGFDMQTLTTLDTITLPYGWFYARYQYEPYLQFSHNKKKTTDILIGQSLSFSTISNNLPTIVISRFDGRPTESPESQAFEFEPGNDINYILDSLEYKIPGNHNVQLMTIGPANPPNPFMPLNFLTTIVSYKHQALALNWIADRKDEKDDDDDKEDEGQGVVQKLDRRLDNAHKAFIKKDTLKAREELLKFVKKVEKLYAESNEHEKNGREKEKYTFTSEAYALLKYNTEYLIQQLPEKKHKGEKEKD